MVSGLALAAWSLAIMRPSAPPPDPPVEAAPVLITESAPDALPEEDTSEPLILYPVIPDTGVKIGTITLPTLGQSWPVYQGTAEDQLSLGVGHFIGSVLPGVRDNSVLSGHRTTVFGRLGELVEGDLINVSTSAGDFTYRVREFRIVPRTAKDVIVPTPSAVLTLTTCYPFDSIVQTTDAFVVSADLIGWRLREQ